MGLLFLDSDFDGAFNDAPAEAYYADPGIGYISPYLYMLVGAVLLSIIIAVAIGAWLGRQRMKARLNDSKAKSVDYIYGSIKYAIEKALTARGLAIIEQGALVREEIHNRLGHVMALTDRPGKGLAALGKALPEPGEPAAPKPAKVKVAMTAEEQMVRVWEELNRLHVFWSDEAHVRGLIEAAQTELARKDAVAFVRDLEARYVPDEQNRPWTRPLSARKAAAAKVIAGALTDADKAGDISPVAPQPEAPAPAPEPDPTPPAPAPKPRGKLPAHKRNMLA